MGAETEALHRLAGSLFGVADEMESERLALQRQLVALTWRGVAAEAVRGAVTDRLCALAEARERHVEAALTLAEHADVVEQRCRLLARAAGQVGSLFT